MPPTSADAVESSLTSRISQAIEDRIEKSISLSIGGIVSERIKDSVSARIEKVISQKVDERIFHHAKHPLVSGFEQIFEDKRLFGSRWILAPSYLILSLVLIALCYKTFEEFYQFIYDFRVFQENTAVIQALTIVDIVLVMNLVLMIMFVGYINFVSKIHPARGEDWPDWTRHLDYSGLKLQLLGSITAISAIVLLRQILDLSQPDSVVHSARVTLMIGIHLTFVVSALIVAWVNKIKAGTHSESEAEADQTQRARQSILFQHS